MCRMKNDEATRQTGVNLAGHAALGTTCLFFSFTEKSGIVQKYSDNLDDVLGKVN